MNWRMRYGRNWGHLGMKSNWITTTLDEVCSLVTDGAHNSPRSVERGYYMASVKDFTEYGFDFSKCRKISKEDYEKLRRQGCVPQKEDVLVGKDGARYFEDIIIYRQDEQPALLSSIAILRVNRKKITPEFLYYSLKMPAIKKDVRDNYGSGSAIPRIVLKDFKRMPFSYPNIDEQQKITAVCSAIDEKIQVNNVINKNLEQQALALFKQYFMDYAPYDGIAPAEWREVSLDDVCTKITDGSHYSPADSPDSPYPMYSVKDMETYGFNSSSCKHITKEDFYKMQKNDCIPLLNDILVAKDGSYLKEIFICSEQKDEAILSSIAIFRPDTQIVIPEILLYLLKQPSVRKDVGDNYVSGSALPRIVLKDFKKYRFMLPPLEEQQKIGSVLHAIRMQIKTNVDEIHCLSSLRDTLLPKLMSGELDVSNLDI